MARRYRILIRLTAFLSLVRWTHIAFIAYVQIVIGLSLHIHGSWTSTLLDPDFLAMLFSTASIVAGGSLINSFYDLERDLTTRPLRTLFEQPVAKKYGAYVATWCYGMGLLIATVFLPWPVAGGMWGFGSLLWFYSHKQLSQTDFGALIATLLAFIPMALLLWMYMPLVKPGIASVWPLAALLFLVEWRRQHERMQQVNHSENSYLQRQWTYKIGLALGVIGLALLA